MLIVCKNNPKRNRIPIKGREGGIKEKREKSGEMSRRETVRGERGSEYIPRLLVYHKSGYYKSIGVHID